MDLMSKLWETKKPSFPRVHTSHSLVLPSSHDTGVYSPDVGGSPSQHKHKRHKSDQKEHRHKHKKKKSKKTKHKHGKRSSHDIDVETV